MHFVADQLFGGPAQHALGGRVDEDRLAVSIDAIDPFAGGVEYQLIFALRLAKEARDPLPFDQAVAQIAIRVRLDILPLAVFQIEGEQQ